LKGIITFIAIAGIALALMAALFFMKHSADKARAKSDEILEEFKTID
jgi:hypothetical protein